MFAQRPAYPVNSKDRRKAVKASIAIRHLVRQSIVATRIESDRICARLTSLTGYDWETSEVLL